MIVTVALRLVCATVFFAAQRADCWHLINQWAHLRESRPRPPPDRAMLGPITAPPAVVHREPKSRPFRCTHGTSTRKRIEWRWMARNKLFCDPVCIVPWITHVMFVSFKRFLISRKSNFGVHLKSTLSTIFVQVKRITVHLLNRQTSRVVQDTIQMGIHHHSSLSWGSMGPTGRGGT